MAITTMKHQHGAVLIVSLVFLIALTAVAAALMQNSSTDMKMSGASQEKLVALEQAISATDELIYKQVLKIDGSNAFSAPLAQFNNPMVIPITLSNITPSEVQTSIAVANVNNVSVACPPSPNGSSVGTFSCSILRVTVTKNYGNNGNNSVQVNTGIAQYLPPGVGG